MTSPRHHPAEHRPQSAVALRSVGVLGGGAVAIVMTVILLASVLSDSSGAVASKAADPVLLTPLATRSIIYDSQGGEMALLYAEQDRQEVPLSTVPDAVQQAVLTIEDADFYQHAGINVRSGVRAVKSNIGAGGIEQGGSTITQQLIKNSVTGSQRTVNRKLREAVLALRLETQLSKKQILERYLNTVYLGHGAYGVQAFAETYFNKRAEDLQWPEAVLMASLIRNPVNYDPIQYPKVSAKRVALVTKRLVTKKVITQAQADEILRAPLPTQQFERVQNTAEAELIGGSYFAEEVKQYLLDLPVLGATKQDRYDAVFKGGLRIHTTYDPDAQRAAEEAVKVVPDTGGKYFTGLASLDPKTGGVRAVVGGPDYGISKINYMTQGYRQPGSTYKFFVLMAAFEAGYIPTDTISGAAPCRFPNPGGTPDPAVVDKSKRGGSFANITSQTARSSNCAFMRLGQTVGLDKVADMANRLGITTTLSADEAAAGQAAATDASTTTTTEASASETSTSTTTTTTTTTPTDAESTEPAASAAPERVGVPVPSNILTLPLGVKEAHPLDMAAAYAAAANDGIYNKPYYVDKITDAKGKVLYEHKPEGVRVVSVQTARLVTQVLAKNVVSGTGKNAKLKKQVAAGKTGTTQDNSDVWFVGYTPYLATSIWLGSPDNREKIVIKGKAIFGADYPAKVFGNFNTKYHESLEPVAFKAPEDTRKGKVIRYKNKYDSGNPRPAAPATTLVPGAVPGAPPAGAPAPAPPAPA